MLNPFCDCLMNSWSKQDWKLSATAAHDLNVRSDKPVPLYIHWLESRSCCYICFHTSNRCCSEILNHTGSSLWRLALLVQHMHFSPCSYICKREASPPYLTCCRFAHLRHPCHPAVRHEGALRGGAILGAAIWGSGACVRQAAVVFVGGCRPVVPQPQFIWHHCPSWPFLVTLSAQGGSPYDLRTGGSQSYWVYFIPMPGLFKHSPCRVRVGCFKLCFHTIVSLLVILQAAHHHWCGAPFNVQRVLFDPVLGGRLALAVQINALMTGPVPGRQVGHAPWIRGDKIPRRLVPLPLPLSGFGRGVLCQCGVVGVHLSWVVVLRAGVAGARGAVIHGVRTITATSPRGVEIRASGLIFWPKELSLGF